MSNKLLIPSVFPSFYSLSANKREWFPNFFTELLCLLVTYDFKC